MLENAFLAASPPDDLRKYGLEWFIDFVIWLIAWFQAGLKSSLRTFGEGPLVGSSRDGTIFDTPLPGGKGFGGKNQLVDLVLGNPGGDWGTIHDAVTPGPEATILVAGIVVLFVSVQVQHVTRIFNYSNVYREKRTKRSAYAAILFILLWYYIGVFMLFFVDGLTTGLAPKFGFISDPAAVSGSQTILEWVDLNVVASAGPDSGDIVRDPGAASGKDLYRYPVFALPAYLIAALSAWAVQAVFTLRWVLIYIYMYMMPLGIALWFGNIPYVSSVAERFSKHFFTWALLPLPVALAIRGYKLIYEFTLSFGDTGKFMLGIIFPVLLLVVTVKTFQYAQPTREVVSSTVKETASDVNAYFQGTGAADAVVRRNAEDETVGADQSVGRRSDNSS